MAEVRRRGLQLDNPESFESSSGIGVTGKVKGQRVVLGNTALMESEQAGWTPLRKPAEDMRSGGASIVYLAADRRLVGLVAVSDPFKQTTPEALENLKKAGVKVIMATGDGITTPQSVAAQLGISEVHGKLSRATSSYRWSDCKGKAGKSL